MSVAALRNVQTKAIKALSFMAFACAIAGGAGLPDTMIGGWISSIVGVIPALGVFFILCALVAWMIQDLLHDMEPNIPAIWAGILLPTVAAAITSKIGDWIEHASGSVMKFMSHWATPVFGDASQSAFTGAFIIVALVLCRRSVTRGGHR
jgi:hypothetical protein